MFLKLFVGKICRSSLFKNAGTYGLFSLINSAIPFLLLPVLTRYLTPEDYGYVAVFNVMVALVVPFLGCNVAGAYSRVFFDQERFDHQSYLGTVSIFVVGSFLFYLFMFCLFKDSIAKIFIFPVQWIWLVPIIAMSTVFIQITQVSWQIREMPFFYGLFQNGRTLVEISLALLLIISFNMGWQGRVFSRVIVGSLFVFIGFFFLCKNRWIKFCFKLPYLRHALFFGVPLIAHSLSGILNTSIDRIFISHMVGIADTGIYTVGYQIGTIINLFAASFNQAYVPWLYRKLNENISEMKKKIVKFTYAYFLFILVLAIGFSYLAPLFMDFFLGKAFSGSSVYVLWIALGYAFNGMYFMVVNYIFYAEKTHLLAVATVLGAAINIVLNYFFIKANGAIGAAQATSLTYFIVFILVWFLSSRVYPMPWLEVFKFKKFFRG